MSRKLTYDYVKSCIESVGYKLLSDNYINNSTNLKLMCPKKHKFEAAWGNFGKEEGTRCPICANVLRGPNKVSIDYIKKYAEKFKYKCLSNKPKKAIEHLKFECDKGHKIKISWCNFKKGHRCAICSLHKRTKYKTETERNSYYNYKEHVNRITNNNFCKYYYTINPDKLERAYDKYHLDHKYSIISGFKNKVPAKIIANPYNLQMLWCTDNMIKNRGSDITIEELYTEFNKFK